MAKKLIWLISVEKIETMINYTRCLEEIVKISSIHKILSLQDTIATISL